MNEFPNPATGVPFQQVPTTYAPYYQQPQQFDPTQQQQPFFRGTGRAGRGGRLGRGARGGWNANTNGVLSEAAARAEARNRDRVVDNMVSNPAFWATVFTTLQRYPEINETIRRDLEEQEKRVAQARERKRRGGHNQQQQQENRPHGERGEEAAGRTRRNYDSAGNGVTAADDERGRRQSSPSPTRARPYNTADSGVGGGEQAAHRDADGDGNGDFGDDERDGSRRVDDLPDLYGYLTGDMDNMRQAVGVQRLGVLLDELEIDALWSARDVTVSFGPLTRALLRLFIGPYATDEEKTIVRMLNLGVERAARHFGFEDYDDATRGRPQSEEPFVVTYRRRGRMLRDFAAFRYMLQITENMGRISQKHKNDLIYLYLTLTTPEVRLHRRWNAEDSANAMAFRDQVTGYAITTPLVMARPMTIEMKLDSVFGNVSANSRLLERSLLAASKNRHRKTNGLSAAQEVEMLMEDARLLDLSAGGGDTNSMRAALKPYRIDGEHAALRHMLEMSTVVSMMAEEFRVFVAGAPQSRLDGGDGRNGADSRRSHTATSQNKRPQPHNRQAYAFRKPIFLAFKTVSAAAASKKYE